ncbi:phage portal protein [Cytobacillus solani]|uniref:Phage portal protein n=2 Tax=Cytobacillus solani TaxID=1637975 RepID=A0A0Q3VIP7_9BACI|nr:phage portal protein [Cytobacillus solani]
MFDYGPREYEDFRESNALIKSEAAEFERLNAQIADVLSQFFIDTATWGLSRWERLVGVTTDESKPLSQRRSVVKAKLRGVGTVTVDLIKSVSESWYAGEVEVTQNTTQYLVTVEFTSSYGVPENLDDVERALREIIPAHLQLAFKFRFVTYDMLKATGLTYDEIKATGLTYDEIKNGGIAQ